MEESPLVWSNLAIRGLKDLRSLQIFIYIYLSVSIYVCVQIYTYISMHMGIIFILM